MQDAEKGAGAEKSCWCLFRMSVLSQVPGGKSMHRDSYGRFAGTAASGDNTSLGWNDFQPMADFADPALGFLVVRAISPLRAAGRALRFRPPAGLRACIPCLQAFTYSASPPEQHAMVQLAAVRQTFAVRPSGERGWDLDSHNQP